jgi:hypothetical protein
MQIMKLPTKQSSPVQCYFISLRLKYPPQDPILKHHPCHTSRLTPVYKNKNIYNSIYINIRTLLDSKLKTKLTAETEMKHTVVFVGYFSMVTLVRLMINVVCGYECCSICGTLQVLQCSEVTEQCVLWL